MGRAYPRSQATAASVCGSKPEEIRIKGHVVRVVEKQIELVPHRLRAANHSSIKVSRYRRTPRAMCRGRRACIANVSTEASATLGAPADLHRSGLASSAGWDSSRH